MLLKEFSEFVTEPHATPVVREEVPGDGIDRSIRVGPEDRVLENLILYEVVAVELDETVLDLDGVPCRRGWVDGKQRPSLFVVANWATELSAHDRRIPTPRGGAVRGSKGLNPASTHSSRERVVSSARAARSCVANQLS